MSASKIAQQVGDRVRQLRAACGLTQAQLAEKPGMATQAVSRIERGERSPTLETLDKLAAALGVGLGELADAGQTLPRPTALPDDIRGVAESLVGQPAAMRARVARVVAALLDE